MVCPVHLDLVMQVQNSEIAKKFNEVADLLEIEGDNPFRIRAYRNAARTLVGLPESISEYVHEHKDLTDLPGIGDDLALKITELVSTGHLSLLEKIEKRTPADLLELLRIPTLGPKRVQILYRKLGIACVNDLQKAVEAGQVSRLRGFGEKTVEKIRDEIQKLAKKEKPRLNLADAEEAAALVSRYLKKAPGLEQLAVAGSFRRCTETVGDLDILMTCQDNKAALQYFSKFEIISRILAQGTTRATVILRSGVQVDVRAVPDDSYGAALVYFTGSKAHNIALRTRALKKGLKVNEYGVFKGPRKMITRQEEDVYRAVGLPFIEPELRENRGEIEAAQRGILPKLVRREDIRGDLHAHTKATDGVNTLMEMATAAQNLGYSYLAITDHTKRVTVARGLDRKRLLSEIEEIDELNSRLKDFTILKSIEVDILEDGRLDLPNDVLAELDLTVCAIHSQFHFSRAKQTERIMRAMDNPHFRIFAHPTGRLLGAREPYEVDLEKILVAAKERRRIFEINCQPERMDLSDIYCRTAKDIGVKMAISTDAHSTSQLRFMKFGVGQARRGWLEKNNVINTLPLEELRKVLKG